MFCEYGLKRKPSQGASVLWHLRVAEGDHLTERSEGRKLPQRKTRALAVLRKLKTLLGGAPGGVQRGQGGAQPLTGPLCPAPGRRLKCRSGINSVPKGQPQNVYLQFRMAGT